MPKGANGDGMLYHFRTANGDVAYCYNWDLHAPDETNGVDYNQYKFFDGMDEVTGEQKASQVEAALEAGYHKNADTGKYEIAPQFQNDAQSSFQKVKQEMQGSALTQQYGPLYGAGPSNYNLQQFEEDVTQAVIWKLGGAPSDNISDPGYLATHTTW